MTFFSSQKGEGTLEELRPDPLEAQQMRRYGLFTYELVRAAQGWRGSFAELAGRIELAYEQRPFPTPQFNGALSGRPLAGADHGRKASAAASSLSAEAGHDRRPLHSAVSGRRAKRLNRSLLSNSRPWSKAKLKPMTLESQLAALHQPLLRFAQLQLRQDSLAEDAVSETFLAILEKPEAFEGRSSLRTYATGILKFKIIDLLRKRGREVHVEPLE